MLNLHKWQQLVRQRFYNNSIIILCTNSKEEFWFGDWHANNKIPLKHPDSHPTHTDTDTDTHTHTHTHTRSHTLMCDCPK